ncbi:MAG: hypothetical protein ACJAS9_001025 [Polaribacter sp.]|jgi:hypothetical protein
MIYKIEDVEMTDLFLVLVVFLINIVINSIMLCFTWNWVIPHISSLPEFSILTAVGMQLLLRAMLGKGDFISAKFK